MFQALTGLETAQNGAHLRIRRGGSCGCLAGQSWGWGTKVGGASALLEGSQRGPTGGGCRWGASCRVGGGLVCVLLAAYLGTWKKAQHIVDAQES